MIQTKQSKDVLDNFCELPDDRWLKENIILK